MNEEEWYRWECWHDRPSYYSLSEIKAVFRLYRERFGGKGIAVYVIALLTTMIIWLLYTLTLPFAFINEWARRW